MTFKLAYTLIMTTFSKPVDPELLLPRDADATGPQNDAERRLYELVMEGVNSGPSLETNIAELTAELRARIRAKRTDIESAFDGR
jgi:hypothetical protein